MKKKICFFSSNVNNSGGTERVSFIIANELVKYGYEIIFLSLFEGLDPHFELDNRIKIYTLNEKKISLKYNFFSIIKNLRIFSRYHKLDCIINIESTLSLFVCPALFLTKIKHINWEHFNFSVNLGKKSRSLSRYLAAIFADYVVTLTKADENLWKNNSLLFSKIITIPNPSPSIENKKQPELKNKIALSIGRYTKQKGFDLLIDSWKIVKELHPDWQLLIIGDGEEKENLKKMIDNYQLDDVIKLLPFTKEINSFYQKSSCYIMSSRFEGFPMVLLEASSFGLPIISFDCPTGPKEIVIHNKNGYLIENNNTAKLADMINKLISLDNDRYKSFSDKSLEQSYLFKIEKIIPKWLTLLETI